MQPLPIHKFTVFLLLRLELSFGTYTSLIDYLDNILVMKIIRSIRNTISFLAYVIDSDRAQYISW